MFVLYLAEETKAETIAGSWLIAKSGKGGGETRPASGAGEEISF